jgi:hypothetical protein
MPDRELAEDLTRELVELYSQAETRLAQDIASELARGIDTPQWAADKLAAVGKLRRAGQKVLGKLESDTDAATLDMIAQAYAAGGEAGLAELAELGGLTRSELTQIRRAIPGAEAVQRMTLSLAGRLRGTHLPVLRWELDTYRRVIATVSSDLSLGLGTRRRVAQKAWEELLAGGVTGFTDRAGRRWNLATYVEMATRTGAAQAAVEGHLDRLASVGVDLVVVSDAAMECRRCRPWEGKVLERAGQSGPHTVEVEHAINDGETVSVKVAGSVAEAIAAGFMHPQCRHSLSAYLPGVTKPATGTADPDGEAAREKLRKLERQVRKTKIKAAAVIDPAARAGHEAEVRQLQAQIRAHVAANENLGLRRKPHRERINLGHGPLPPAGGRPVQPPKPPTPPPPPVRPVGPPGDPRANLRLAPSNPTPEQRSAALGRWQSISSQQRPNLPTSHDLHVLQYNKDEVAKAERRRLDLQTAIKGADPNDPAVQRLKNELADVENTIRQRTRYVAEYTAKAQTHLPPFDPRDPLSGYGGRLHIPANPTLADYEALAEVEAYPTPAAHRAVRNHMAASERGGLYYGPQPLPQQDHLGDLAGQQTRDGRPYDEVGGLYRRSTRVCATTSHAPALARSQGHVSLHEFGHALDDALGTQGGSTSRYLSAGGRMAQAIEDIERDHGTMILPYFRATTTTSNGRAEAFANAYAFWSLHRGTLAGDELALRVGGSLTGYTSGSWWPAGSTRDALVDIGRRMITELEALGLD